MSTSNMPSPSSVCTPERLSIEVTRRCAKACAFCYNASGPLASAEWPATELVAFARDCARHGTKAVSFGGGEPLQYEPLFDVLEALDGVLFRSLTTNGLLLDRTLEPLLRARPDKVHISVHEPTRDREVARVIRQVRLLRAAGVRAGVNLLVRRSERDAAAAAAQKLRAAGIGHDALVYLPMRGSDEPTAAEVATVAGGAPFQSMTCLKACGPSPRFASVDVEGAVGHCSYTLERRPLPERTAAGLHATLEGLGLRRCGQDSMPGSLVRLGRSRGATR